MWFNFETDKGSFMVNTDKVEYIKPINEHEIEVYLEGSGCTTITVNSSKVCLNNYRLQLQSEEFGQKDRVDKLCAAISGLKKTECTVHMLTPMPEELRYIKAMLKDCFSSSNNG